MPNPALAPKRPEYYVQVGSMFENPHGVPHDEIMQMVMENPAEVSAQTIFGKYVESSGLVFTGETIQQMIDRGLPRITGDRWFDANVRDEAYRLPFDSLKRRFHTGIDFARQTDYTVISVLDCRTLPARLVYYRRLNRVPWESIYTEVGRVIAVYGQSALADSTGMGGDVVMDALDSRFYCRVHDQTRLLNSGNCTDKNGQFVGGCGPPHHVMLGCVEGYNFSGSTKKQLVEHLRNVAQSGYRYGSEAPFGHIRIPPIVQAEEEMSFYIWDDKGLETDVLMSLALAAWQGLEDAPGAVDHGSVHGS
jgi:hypothetical protein